jgi:photosystem II stability/assembly factor-like uncharacterized protein
VVTASRRATMPKRSFLWFLVAIAVLPMECGCGTLTRLTQGSGATSAASTPTTRRLVAAYIASVNRQDGTITFTPAPVPGTGGSTSGTPQSRGLGRRPRKNRGVHLQATNYGPSDRLNMKGTAAFDGVAGILKGFVNISTTNAVTFYDVKAVITQITSSGSVTVKNNGDGMTDVAGTPAPYYSHGNVASANPQSRLWEFTDPSGVSFTFRVLLYANVWNFSTGDGGTVGGIYFLNATTGWAVGVAGKIFTTSDGGATWRPQSAATTRSLNDVCFVDANRGWAVGDSGTILTTSNGGRSWERQSSPVPLGLNGVRFLNSTTGVIVGNTDNSLGMTTILRTTNGGTTWTRITSLPEGNLFSVAAAKDGSGALTAVGTAGGGPFILRSTDGGQNWTEQSAPADLGSFASLQAVDFPTATRGWAVGTQATLLFTNDGGNTWTQQSAPSAGSYNLNSVTFVNANLGWIVGQRGTIAKTTNGGATWTAQISPSGTDLWALASLPGDTTHAWASGSSGTLLYTTAGGSPWSSASAAVASSINAVKFIDSDYGWVVGSNGTMLRTINAGQSWIPMTGNGATMTDIDFVNRTNGWAVGGSNTILRTSNGGGSWAPITLPVNVSGTYSGVKFISATTGFVVGNGKNGLTPAGSEFLSGLYLKTVNGGTAWTVKPDPNGTALPPLNAVDFADDTTGWIVGSTGRILKTTNGGTNWSTQSSGSGQHLYALKAIDAQHACAVGQSGFILRTNDGGATWSPQSSGLSVDLSAVDFLDQNQGWVVGSTRAVQENGVPVIHETVLRTTDGGNTWKLVDTNTNVRLNGVQFVNADDGWIVGVNGLIKRYH